MKTIGIMGAMPEEVALVAGRLENPSHEQYAGVVYHIGSYAGHRLVVCCGGMGKANAASTTQVLVTRYGAEAILFSGIAGNTSTEIGIGDVVIGESCVHHDSENRMIMQSAPGVCEYPADPVLVAAAERACEKLGVRYLLGRIATGERFVGDAETKRAIQKLCQPACVEMEGAAVGQIALRNETPFLVLRAMSDNCEESVESLGAEEFDVSEYVKTASAIVLEMIKLL